MHFVIPQCHKCSFFY